MRTLTIDRIEGIYAICTDKAQKVSKDKQKFFGIQVSELPHGASAGDTVEVDDETGTLTLVRPADKKKQPGNPS